MNLIDKTNCRYLFRGASNSGAQVLGERDLEILDLVSLEECLEETPVKECLYDETWETAHNKPFVILHTTGSTGLPKPVVITHSLMSTIDAFHNLKPVEGQSATFKKFTGTRMYCALPPFHSAGINFCLLVAIFHETVMVCGPPERIPSVELAQEIHNFGNINGAIMAPIILEKITHNSEAMKMLDSWDYVSYGGGPLAQEAGDLILAKTRLSNTLGLTETFFLAEMDLPDKADWAYHHFYPDLIFEMRPTGDEQHELVFVRNKDAEPYQGAFRTFLDLEEYSMKDLYTRHPSRPDYWLYSGRMDDIIVLSNGEKLNPIRLERKIAAADEIKDALVVGRGKFHPVVLIEVEKSSHILEMPTPEQKDVLWGPVKEANELVSGHAKLSKDSIGIIKGEDEFPRSTKGAVRREAANRRFSKQIEALYEAEEQGSSEHLDATNRETFEHTLEAYLLESLEIESLEHDQSFFDVGIDSLHVMRLVKHLRDAIGDPERLTITNKTIYTNHNIRRLSDFFWSSRPTSPQAEGAEMEEMLQSLCKSLPKSGSTPIASPRDASQKVSVALTGSTGSLGAYMLDALLRNPIIDRVFCLNRTDDAQERQGNNSKKLGLLDGIKDGRAIFLKVDLKAKRLGLPGSDYANLQFSVQHLVHNAWLVDFNLPFSSFTPHLEGVRELIEFSVTAPTPVHFTFLSSVGASNNWPINHDGPVPEDILHGIDTPEPCGYGQSKLVAEQLLDWACKNLEGRHFRPTVCRITQIGGPVDHAVGEWKKSEWFPSLLKSSKALGVLPRNLGGHEHAGLDPRRSPG